MNIKFKFIGLGINNDSQANIKIYHKDNLIVNNKTYNGCLLIDLIPNKIYKLVATFYNEKIITYFYSNKNQYCYIFNHAIYVPVITLSLKDYYYNLPIEKGEVILWQKQ
jgi:hypothetical protein